MTIKQIAANYGVAQSAQLGPQADVEDGNRPGTTAPETSEDRELKKWIRLNRIIEPNGYLSVARQLRPFAA